MPWDGAWCLPSPKMRRSRAVYPMPLQVVPPPQKKSVFTPEIWSFKQVSLPCRKEYNAFKGGNSTFNARIEGALPVGPVHSIHFLLAVLNLRQARKAEIFGDGYWTNAAASCSLMASTSGRLATTALHPVHSCPIHHADAKFIRFA